MTTPPTVVGWTAGTKMHVTFYDDGTARINAQRPLTANELAEIAAGAAEYGSMLERIGIDRDRPRYITP